MTGRRKDVLVLGGGVIGLACALALLKDGRGVTVIEQRNVGSGASHGNCGTITPSLLPMPAPGVVGKGLKWLLTPDAPLRIKPTLNPELIGWLMRFGAHCNAADFERAAQLKGALLKASRNRLETLVRDEGLDCQFESTGHLMVYRTAAALEQTTAEMAMWKRLEIDVERLDGDACRAREPALNASIVGGFFHPGDAQLRPDNYLAELARRVRELGGKIQERNEITGIRCSAARIDAIDCVDHHSGEKISFAADEVIFALGAWSPKLGKALGLRLPIQPGKGYSMTWSAQAGAPRQPLILKERSVCVTAWADGFRLGSTMEFAGYDESLNRVRLDALKRGAADYLRVVPSAEPLEQWFGWRPMTPDDLPIMGRASSLENLVLATGHGMLGISMSAITGHLIAELLAGRAPSIDLAPFSPQRFAR